MAVDLLAEVAATVSECSQLWGSNSMDDVDRVVFSLEKHSCDLSDYYDDLVADECNLGPIRSLQQCISQLKVYWETKLSNLVSCGRGRRKIAINVELVRLNHWLFLYPIPNPY
jgi:hypothetical protein